MERPSDHAGITLADLAVGLLCVVSVTAILLGQFVSLVVFDTTGLDQYVPGPVIYSVVPAALLTAVPAVVAVHRYDRQRALALSAGVFVAALAASFFTMGFLVIG